MLVHCSLVTPSVKFTDTHLYTWVDRGTVRVKCLAQEHNTMSAHFEVSIVILCYRSTVGRCPAGFYKRFISSHVWISTNTSKYIFNSATHGNIMSRGSEGSFGSFHRYGNCTQQGLNLFKITSNRKFFVQLTRYKVKYSNTC